MAGSDHVPNAEVPLQPTNGGDAAPVPAPVERGRHEALSAVVPSPIAERGPAAIEITPAAGGRVQGTVPDGLGASDGMARGETDPPPARELTHPLQRLQRDPNGFEVQNVFWQTRQFVVYEADEQVRYMLPDDYEVAKALRHKVADLGGLRASIENLRADPALSAKEKTRAARETAWALAQAFEDTDDPPSERPKDILTRVDARLRSLVKSHYRKKYLIANLYAFVGIEAIFLLLAVMFANAALQGNLAALPHYALYGALGALGAFLSVITRARSIDVDIDLKTWEHVFAGATRILIGVVGGLVIGLALDSRFVDPTFGSNIAAGGEAAKPTATAVLSLDKQMAMYFLFAFLGGFSESLVPNLLRRGEQAAGGSEAPSPDEPIVRGMKP